MNGNGIGMKIAFRGEIIHVVLWHKKINFQEDKNLRNVFENFSNAFNAADIKTNWNSLPMNYSHDSMLFKHTETVGNAEANSFWQSNKLFMTKKE